jgi:1-acyl-sn-glycerol-3-phosphate acyltransferase
VRYRLISVFVWLAWSILTIAWTPLLAIIFLFTAPFDPGRYTVGRWFRRAAVIATALNPLWRFRTSGVRIADPRRPYVAVSNHESYADIFLISHLPWEMKWLSKDQIFRVPFMGWMMRMAGDISVKRDSARSRMQSVEAIRDRLGKKVSVMIMPEGTRSRTEDLLPFRDGAFRVAIEQQVPVLPIAVAGTRSCIAPDSMVVRPARAEARVLPPIETAGMTLADVETLKQRVRDEIVAARAELQRELGLA